MIGPVCLSMTLLLGATQSDPPANWKAIAPKDAGFSVAMPTTPMEKKQTVKIANSQVNVHLLVAEGRNDSTFVVSYCDFPATDLKKEDIEKRLNNARDGAERSSRGKIRGEKEITLAGHPGREILIEKDGSLIVQMRIYVVQRRLYQVMVLGTGSSFASKDAGIFFDSFRLNK